MPPEHLGAWLRDFDALLSEHGLSGVPYGHFGDGCVHVRIDFDFDDGGARFRDFLTASARRLADYGGSLSGEHGDGRARSELLPLMYDAQSLALFGAVKAACDPDGLLNPGVLTDPAPLDADLRPARPVAVGDTGLRLTHDDGSLGAAVHRCTGVGKCVAPATTGVMCPSYLATREEKDSTRGRARVLQEALDGTPGRRALSDPAVHEALDLCLSCKGCASDCPTGVDMAAYKAEALHQTYARPPPAAQPLHARPAAALGAADRAGGAGGEPDAAAGSGRPAGQGHRRHRPAPRAARARAPDACGARPAAVRATGRRTCGSGPTRSPTTWPRTPRTRRSGCSRPPGSRVRVIDEPACCGLTWVSTGQLDAARRIVARTVATLAPYVDGGTPVLGLEPSCLATLRSDAVELADDPRAAAVADGVLTLAELLERLDWTPPDLTGVEVVVQPHCHHASVLGFDADERLLAGAGAQVTRVAGCCGLAGNFGMERGHYETSVAVAETHLLPAVRSAPDAVVLADGMSCRLQLADLAGVPAMHLAELLASRLEE